MNGYYLWIPKDDFNTGHPLEQKQLVQVSNKRVRIFGSNKSWSIHEAQTRYGLLGAKIHKLIE